jgi:5-methylcytosine-specific restriction endonuclease McrA
MGRKLEHNTVTDEPIRNRRSFAKRVQLDIFERDGWLCCWCKRPVIFPPVMKFLEAEVRNAGRSGLAYYHTHWTRYGAPLLDELGAVIDHVEAFSTGGLDSTENLITAWNKCNGHKSAAPLDRWSKRPMRKPIKGKYGEPQHWDGLASVFVMLADRNMATLTGSERDWLTAFKSNGNPAT